MRFCRVIISIILCQSVPATTGVAQQCHAFINPTTQLNRFILKNSVVLDQIRKLEWMRCSVGQQWDTDKKLCSGTALQLSRRQALAYIKNINSKQETLWRLPSLPELTSLTELSCFNPAINMEIFNNTPPSHFWSATKFVNGVNQYWLVQFYSGESHADTAKRTALVRLVRDVTTTH